MKTILPMMLIGVLCSAASAQGVPGPIIPPPPGPLETFLANNPDATVVKKQTGVLVGTNQEKAFLIAIVASSPAEPSVKFKGMEIQITDTGHAHPLYLDYEPAVPPDREDNFEHFLESLADLADKNAVIKRFYEQEPNATDATRWGTTTGAYTRSFHIHVLNIGWRHTEEDMGVSIDGAGSTLGSFYFPGTTIAQVIESFKAARNFLIAN